MPIQITIRDVPEKVRDELAARAAVQGKSMQEYLRLELERLAARPCLDAWLQQVRQLNLDLFAFEPFAERIWQLRYNLTSYDAWYVAVTEALTLPLATLDQRLARAAGPTCDFLTPTD